MILKHKKDIQITNIQAELWTNTVNLLLFRDKLNFRNSDSINVLRWIGTRFKRTM